MKININPDKEFVNDMRKALKDNNGFFPYLHYPINITAT